MTTEKNSNKNLHEFIDSWNDTAKAKITGKVLLLFQYYIIQYAKKHNNNPLNETTLQKIGDEFLVLFSNGQKKDDYLYHKRNLRIAFNLIEPILS